MFNANKRASEFLREVENKIEFKEFRVGDRFKNLKNGTFADIVDIKNGVATMNCYEKIYGFFKIHNELCEDVATRTIHLKLLKKGIKEGIFKKVE
ncbi:TPA: hypothetical protein ACY4SF_000164 [Clostridium perfringens]|uniref:hypothetical protein n=1 Tax=Clostridium perfringens TaxID=1502 RepID=UPI0011599C4B|nr:hypothetical protein [Clostridium perfringens]EHA6440829.1 hypothetical protein [Clostridium perfringens]MDM0967790.1 hypothetical protein [Clostridium perfringens]MDU2048643.1 hypothetical protein [Clostridium perfringens]MEA5272221.1 hypothetical protein [Clostridium perfringens]MEA5312264.1 hypothetical protein [Clostridium perfringens]